MAAKNGDTVSAHYVGTLPDGTEFDSSREREPLEFVLGKGMLIPGFEQAVIGRKVGETVEVTIPPAEAYGERNDDMVLVVPRSEVPDHIEPEVGMMVQLASETGEMDVMIARVTDEEVELDANHPLAGQALHFSIEIVKITPA